MASRLERLLGIEKVIRTGSYPGVSDLCQMFEIQPRTLFQDIKELRENLRCPIKFDRARQGYFSNNPQHQLPSFSLTEDELFVLTIATELFTQISGSSIAAQAQTALAKIAQNSNLEYKESLGSIRTILKASSTHTTNISLSKLRALCSACVNSRLIIIDTSSNNPSKEHKETIEPHYLEHAASRWFLVGFSRKTMRLFHCAIDAIESYEMTDMAFERRNDLVPL